MKTTQATMKREIKYAKRVIGMLAKYAIRNDPVRSLVELITNSDDSFNRMGNTKVGKITISVRRGRNYTYLIVSDNAEGMSYDEMDKSVGGYGFETSGFLEGKSVRGLFGRGLKEAILGLGSGVVRSIKDGQYVEAKLNTDGIYEIRQAKQAGQLEYAEMDLAKGETGTQIVIEIRGEDVKVPQFESLKSFLQNHVSLRDIMTNKKRLVRLNYINRRITEQLTYKYPKGEQIFNQEGIRVQGFPNVTFDLKIFRAETELSQGEDTMIRDGGIMIRSGNSIHEATLFKFDDNQYARRLFGELRCEYITDLIKKGDAIISDKRDGLERKHEFAKALKYEVEQILEPIVADEKRRYEEERGVIESKKTTQSFNRVVQEVNEIAKDELKSPEGNVKVESVTKMQEYTTENPVVFQFSTPYSQVVKGEDINLYLHATVPTLVPSGSTVKMAVSDPKALKLLEPKFELLQEDEIGNTQIKRIPVRGLKVGETVTVTATTDTGIRAECKVKIIAEKEKPEDSEPRKPKAGLFKNIRYNNLSNPKDRASFERDTGTVEIFTKNPSVSMYTGKNGENQEDSKAMVLVSELVVDVVCRTLAKLKDERGMIVYGSDDARVDAIIKEYESLKTKYAGSIHKILTVGKRGRRPNEATT